MDVNSNTNINEGQESPTPSVQEGQFVLHKEFENDGNKLIINYEISHQEIRAALYNLMDVNHWDQEINDWMTIVAVYEDHFVAQGFFTGQLFGSKYVKDGDSIQLDGERYSLYAEYITEEEKNALEEMRANYSSIKESLEKYQKAELNAKKNEIISAEKYSKYLGTEQFKAIMSDLDEIDLQDLKARCELAFAAQFDAAPQEPIKENFSQEEPQSQNQKAPRSMFGFAQSEPVKNSFLEGLRAKVSR